MMHHIASMDPWDHESHHADTKYSGYAYLVSLLLVFSSLNWMRVIWWFGLWCEKCMEIFHSSIFRIFVLLPSPHTSRWPLIILSIYSNVSNSRKFFILIEIEFNLILFPSDLLLSQSSHIWLDMIRRTHSVVFSSSFGNFFFFLTWSCNKRRFYFKILKDVFKMDVININRIPFSTTYSEALQES